MGHWSEELVDEAAQRIGGNPDRQALKAALLQAGNELEVLSGRSFQLARRKTSVFETHGLPFVDVPDMQVGSMEPVAGVTVIPDPANKTIGAVLQLTPLAQPVPRAAPTADGLWFAGQLLAAVSHGGGLSRDYVIRWLGAIEAEERIEVMRRAMDPSVRSIVPILGQVVDGWWIQISRRLMWVTGDMEDEGRLVEVLFDRTAEGEEPIPLVAVEPILIAVPLTRSRADWAFTARVWAEGVRRPTDRPWRLLAGAVHNHGIPTITLDRASTPYEIACQVVLKGYWHGYLTGDEPALANAVAMAYPSQVDRIMRVTGAPSRTTAATTLLEELIRPGFDPARGAEATRRYVRRKASIVVMEHRKSEAPDRYPWTQIGISERRYYKLLPLFANKVNGRYDVNQADVVERMTAYLNSIDAARALRTAAFDVLAAHGFSRDAARKWLQRHPPENAIDAWPRGRRPRVTASNAREASDRRRA